MLAEIIKSRGVVVVAEIGMTHDGSFGHAKNIVSSAIKSGADVIKFQWHIADAETLRSAPTPPYFRGESRFDYFKRTEFTQEQFTLLRKMCTDAGVYPCVSVFSSAALDGALLAGFDLIKVPSGEVSNTPLLEDISTSGVDVICSSGMSNWYELDTAIDILKRSRSLCVLQCTSEYPTPPERVGLNILSELKSRYQIPVGLSDHTLTSATSVAAVALGACVIEKHFTLSKEMYGPDARFSLDPLEFKNLVGDLRYVKKCISNPVDKNKIDAVHEMRLVFQKSIVAARPLRKGITLSYDDLAFKKPGDGLPASRYRELIGKLVTRDITADERINFDMLQ